MEREPTVVIQPRRGLFDLDLKALWQYRELLYFLVWRDVKIRYKQTAIGASWAILQPLLSMIVFTVVFGKLAKLDSDGLPYPIFAYAGLLPWQYFAQAISNSGQSLVQSANLISKLYFPRLVVPIAATVSPLVDFVVSFVVLLGLMVWFDIPPTWRIVVLPLFILLALSTALAVSLFLSALYVQYRDMRYTIPFLVQFWMYASPVVYSVNLLPEQWRLLYGLNPMVGVIEGFRWSLLGKAHPNFWVMGVSAVVVLLILGAGMIYFRRRERTFADVI
jgi:lipopolysaccharide transport system permease protein